LYIFDNNKCLNHINVCAAAVVNINLITL